MLKQQFDLVVNCDQPALLTHRARQHAQPLLVLRVCMEGRFTNKRDEIE